MMACAVVKTFTAPKSKARLNMTRSPNVPASVADNRLGEEVGVAIVIAEGASVTVDEIRDHCANLLAKFKISRWLRAELLPRNASGKFEARIARYADPADAA